MKGNVDIFIAHNNEDNDKWNEILIHGDPDGLKSLAQILINLANINQEKIDNKTLPIGAREHIVLSPNIELSKSSDKVIIGRLDAKITGKFYNRFIPKD